MKKQIKSYFENLDLKKLGIKNKIKVNSISKLGNGTSNLNYLVKTNQGNFIFRMNMNLDNPKKSRKEFEALKIVEKYNFAPKAYILDESRKEFDSDFIIISYIEGLPCNRIKPYFDEKMIRGIGKLLGKIHSIKITSKLNILPSYGANYLQELNSLKKYKRYLDKNIKNKQFFQMINETFNQLRKNILNKKLKSRLVLSHGDFHQENIIINNGKYYLIDFEDLELTNQASALAHLFIDFKHAVFTKKQKNIFLKEYKKYVECNKNIEEEINDFTPLKVFGVFLWSIEFTLKVKNKEMHKKFLEESKHEKNINYAILCFKQALRLGVIHDKYKDFNLKKIIK